MHFTLDLSCETSMKTKSVITISRHQYQIKRSKYKEDNYKKLY